MNQQASHLFWPGIDLSAFSLLSLFSVSLSFTLNIYIISLEGHLPAVNQLASHLFWPGIDLSEVLQYPDFTCVVLYRQGFRSATVNLGVNIVYFMGVPIP